MGHGQRLDLATGRDFGTALLIGALVGTEREKRRSAEAETGIGGLRTFVLIALLGAIAGWLANTLHLPALLVAVLVVLGAAILAGYVLGQGGGGTPQEPVQPHGGVEIRCLLRRGAARREARSAPLSRQRGSTWSLGWPA